MNPEDGISDFTRLRAIIESPGWIEVGSLCEDTDWRPGRRRKFQPHVLALYFLAATCVWKSARKTAAEFADPEMWGLLRRWAQQARPREPDTWLPGLPPKRHHYSYFRRNHLDPEKKRLLLAHEQIAATQAKLIGLCDPNGDGSWNHPATTRTLTADGKVVTPLFRSNKPTKPHKRTGEIRNVRHDPDAKVHPTGDGRMLFGSKFEILHVRGPDRHARIVLSVGVVGKGGEGPALLSMLDRVTPMLPGTQALAYDGGIHGVHMRHILKHNGILPVVPPPGGRADQLPPPRHLETTSDGLQLYTQLGALGLGHLTEAGDVAFERLRRCNIRRRTNADGTFRWYGEWKHPDGRTTRVRLDQTGEDLLRKVNRTENLRAICTGEDDYDRLMGLRSDSESINRSLEDTLYIGRAHSVGKDRQLVDLIGFAIGVNALAVHLHGRSNAPPGELAA